MHGMKKKQSCQHYKNGQIGCCMESCVENIVLLKAQILCFSKRLQIECNVALCFAHLLYTSEIKTLSEVKNYS